MTPIRPENAALYPPDWKERSRAARERAGNRCQECGVPNGAWRNNFTHEFTMDSGQAETWRFADGDPVTYIVLTVAHLDHDPRNCSVDNLRALCQRCHLAYDQEHHIETARRTRRAKLGMGELFMGEVVP